MSFVMCSFGSKGGMTPQRLEFFVQEEREMAFAAALSTPRCIPHSPPREYGLLLCSPKYLKLKYSLGGCRLSASMPCYVSTVPAKESSGVTTSIARGTSRDVPISRMEAILQVVSGAARSLVATGLACCAATLVEDFPVAAAPADGAAGSKPKPKFYDLDGSGGVKALDIREGTGAIPQIGDKVREIDEKLMRKRSPHSPLLSVQLLQQNDQIFGAKSL